MTDSYQLTRLAETDLIEIRDYIAADNAQAANRLLDEFAEKFRMFTRQPMIGEPREEVRPHLRSFPVGNYVIFYQIISNCVVIVRVLHGARDLGKLFERH